MRPLNRNASISKSSVVKNNIATGAAADFTKTADAIAADSEYILEDILNKIFTDDDGKRKNLYYDEISRKMDEIPADKRGGSIFSHIKKARCAVAVEKAMPLIVNVAAKYANWDADVAKAYAKMAVPAIMRKAMDIDDKLYGFSREDINNTDIATDIETMIARQINGNGYSSKVEVKFGNTGEVRIDILNYGQNYHYKNDVIELMFFEWEPNVIGTDVSVKTSSNGTRLVKDPEKISKYIKDISTGFLQKSISYILTIDSELNAINNILAGLNDTGKSSYETLRERSKLINKYSISIRCTGSLNMQQEPEQYVIKYHQDYASLVQIIDAHVMTKGDVNDEKFNAGIEGYGLANGKYIELREL